MEFIYSEIDPIVLGAEEEIDYSNLIFYGVSESFPSSIITSLKRDEMTESDYQIGITRQYITNGRGQYEIVAYPAIYGDLMIIDQNYIGINLVSTWQQEVVQVEDYTYYLYHTQLIQYSDNSTLVFKFNSI